MNIKELNEEVTKVLSETYEQNLRKAEDFANRIIVPELKNLFKNEKGLYSPDMSKLQFDMIDSALIFTEFNLQPHSSGELIDSSKSSHLQELLKKNKATLRNTLERLGNELEDELGFKCIMNIDISKEEAMITLGGKQLYM